MGAGALAAYLLWRVSGIPEFVRAFTAGFFGIMVPALFMAVEFNISGYGRGIFYLLYVYVIVAAVEGLLTLTIVKFFRRVESPILP